MSLSNNDLRKEFLSYLNQTETCDLFYNYMKYEQLSYILEFYFACDGLKSYFDDKKTQIRIIKLIYKHYLSHGKCLSSSKTKFSLPDDILSTIKQQIFKQEFHPKIYEQAEEYVLKYMLQMCYPKYLIEQKNQSNKRRQNFDIQTYTPMYRHSSIATRKKDIYTKLKQQTNCFHNHDSSEGTTSLINENDNGYNSSKHLRTKKFVKDDKTQLNIAQKNPAAFFQEIKTRLLAYRYGFNDNYQMFDDESVTVLDLQIEKTIDDADEYLIEKSKPNRNQFIRYDSGVGTDSSDRLIEDNQFVQKQLSSTKTTLIDVIWYPSLDCNKALLSTISSNSQEMTFKQFRQLFTRQKNYRYFFKTTCTPDINKDQYIFREINVDDELIPIYDGKIFVQLDQI